MSGSGGEVKTGGCQCGAVRFRVEGKLGEASICHCRMCQKAFGSFFAPLVDVDTSDLTWTRGKPTYFESSDVVNRGFCSNCGTPLVFAYRDYHLTGLAIGAFDDPGSIEITKQHWVRDRVSSLVDAVTKAPCDQEDAPEFASIIAEIDASIHQHPDYETPEWPMGKRL